MYASAFATPLRLVYGIFYLAIVTGSMDFYEFIKVEDAVYYYTRPARKTLCTRKAG